MHNRSRMTRWRDQAKEATLQMPTIVENNNKIPTPNHNHNPNSIKTSTNNNPNFVKPNFKNGKRVNENYQMKLSKPPSMLCGIGCDIWRSYSPSR